VCFSLRVSVFQLQCVHCSDLQCVPSHCHLQCVPVGAECDAMCCSVRCSVLQCVCCSVLQSVLQ